MTPIKVLTTAEILTRLEDAIREIRGRRADEFPRLDGYHKYAKGDGYHEYARGFADGYDAAIDLARSLAR